MIAEYVRQVGNDNIDLSILMPYSADPHSFEAWDLRETSRCFVTIANAEQWVDLTGEEPPLSPMTARDYTKAGLPWFDYYGDDKRSIKGAKKLGKIKSVNQIKSTKRSGFLGLWKKDLPVKNPKVVSLGKRKVHSGSWYGANA